MVSSQPHITLFQPGPTLGVPNASPFCLKLETWLRLAGLSFDTKPAPNPAKGPTGKVPWVEIDGTPMGDSGSIISALTERCAITMDDHLQDAQRHQLHALVRMAEEHLYFATSYSRWIEPGSFPTVKEAFKPLLPPVIGGVLPPLIRRQIRKAISAQGLGRHEPKEIYARARSDLGCLEAALGDRPYFGGDQPVTADAALYGQIASIVDAQIDTPLKPIGREFGTLCDYTQRVYNKAFG